MFHKLCKYSGKNVKVEPCGLTVSQEYPFLGASSDGKVVGDESGLVEIKTLLQNNTKTLKQAAKEGKFCLELHKGKLCLKKTHKYYYQCQGEMHVWNMPWVDFIVNNLNPPELHIERIFPDSDVWASILPKLKSFYFKCLLPELAVPWYGKSPGIREPQKPWASLI